MATNSKAILLVLLALGLAACVGASAPSRGSISSILLGDAAGIFEAHANNVGGSDAIQPVTVSGREAVRMELRYEDEGPLLDWRRHGEPGFAQRIQFSERWRNGAMRLGSEYWYAVSFFVEPFPGNRTQWVTVFDLKPVFTMPSGRRHGGQPLFAAEFHGDAFRVRDLFGEGRYECGEYIDISGQPNIQCDRELYDAILGPQARYSGRWVEVVFHAKWADDETGVFRYWVDGIHRFTFTGNTARGAELFEFKFGPYRHNMTAPQGDLGISFSQITRASDCAGLGISNCAELEASGQTQGRRNLQSLSTNYIDELTRFRRDPAGG